MAAFFKLAALAVVVTAGSLLTLWLLFGGHTGLAWLAIAGTGLSAVGVIAWLARETSREEWQ